MAASVLTDGRAVTPSGAVKAGDGCWLGEPQTIIVAQRERGYESFSEILIATSGKCQDDIDAIGTTVKYTQDTGQGHSCRGQKLKIENVIQLDAEGEVIGSVNDIGLDQKRRLWVYK